MRGSKRLFIVITMLLFGLCIGSLLPDIFIQGKEIKEFVKIKKVRVCSYRETKLQVKWKKVKQADGYQIFQYKAKDKKFLKVATVGKSKTSWISKKSKTKKTYKVRAYKKVAGKIEYSKFSYEVTAIPYKKNAKKVNAGQVKANRYYKKLSYYETTQIKVKVKPSKYAKNKKAKAYDTALRWYTTNQAIATVDGKGVVTPTGAPGTCFVYARAHNGNYTGKIRIKVVNYARPKKFNDIEHTQEDVANLLTNYAEELMAIGEFYERKWAEDKEDSALGHIKLNEARTDLMITNSELEYQEIYDTLLKILSDYPGMFKIIVADGYIVFNLSDGYQYIALTYLYEESAYYEETPRNFYVAPRWSYETYRYI